MMIKDFKAFLLKQNALALAIGVMIGAAIGKIVTSIADDVINPIIGLFMPGGDWRKAGIVLSRSVDAAGKVTENSITYGHLIGSIVDFVIIAFVLFLIVRAFVRGGPPTTKPCPQCKESIPLDATRCRACAQPVP